VTFEEYVTLRGPALVRFARLLARDGELGEDLAQEVLARAYVRWGSIGRLDQPDVYLRRMLVNARHSWWRRRSSHEVVGLPPIDRASTERIDAEVAERDRLWRLIRLLPTKQRACVVLRYYEDLDDVRIGEIVGCSPITVRTHVMRALAGLRQHLGDPAEPSTRSPR
jgi:RNA polymerase sigma-70 factor (sigma-E family)